MTKFALDSLDLAALLCSRVCHDVIGPDCYGMFGKGFDSPGVIMIALGMTILVSIVEGGIPNGGYVGELLFISAYGFPPETLPPAIIIGTLIDPIATLLNATGDTVAAMMINRFVEGKLLEPAGD